LELLAPVIHCKNMVRAADECFAHESSSLQTPPHLEKQVALEKGREARVFLG